MTKEELVNLCKVSLLYTTYTSSDTLQKELLHSTEIRKPRKI